MFCGAGNLACSRLSRRLFRFRELIASEKRRLKAGGSQDWLPHSIVLVICLPQTTRKEVLAQTKAQGSPDPPKRGRRYIFVEISAPCGQHPFGVVHCPARRAKHILAHGVSRGKEVGRLAPERGVSLCHKVSLPCSSRRLLHEGSRPGPVARAGIAAQQEHHRQECHVPGGYSCQLLLGSMASHTIRATSEAENSLSPRSGARILRALPTAHAVG